MRTGRTGGARLAHSLVLHAAATHPRGCSCMLRESSCASKLGRKQPFKRDSMTKGRVWTHTTPTGEGEALFVDRTIRLSTPCSEVAPFKRSQIVLSSQ